MCRDEGINVVTNAKVSLVKGKSGESIRLLGARDGGELFLEGTHLLVAGGRRPNTSGIGLEKAGVETTDRGHVKVNARLQTTAEGVWGIAPMKTYTQRVDRTTGDLPGIRKITTLAFSK
jgi:pyruvate/2-oxoglutarate dehydrogenase complex dihydrolipoamide dehydrogenase (E3) component